MMRAVSVGFPLVVGAAAVLQTPPSEIIPVYRALLEQPAATSRFDDTCGAANGPFTVFPAGADRASTTALVKALDDGRVMETSRTALAKAAAALPGPAVTVCLYPGELSNGLPHLGGVGGISLGGGRIKMFLHPAPRQLDRVSYTVAHEYHHEVERVAGPGGFDPIDIVVREGKADYFAVSLYPRLRPPHTQPLSAAELKAAWQRLAEHQRAPSATFRRDFMIGAFTPGSTKWPGYRLGYQMAEEYFRGSRATPAEIVRTPAGAIHEWFGHRIVAAPPDAGRQSRLRCPHAPSFEPRQPRPC